VVSILGVVVSQGVLPGESESRTVAITHSLAVHPDAAELRRRTRDYLKVLREAAGLTQNELSTAIGLPYYSTISQIELGKTRLLPSRLQDWAKALGANERAFAKRMLSYNEPHMWNLLYGSKGR
tara:strand:- start:146 stop:517 length:372 start_codon:yes stop_codon:yes gene_type:complete